MKETTAKKVPKKLTAWEDIIATFCFIYSQYTFEEARRLPNKRVLQMLKVARREQALTLYNITRIAAAPHQRKGTVSKLLQEFKNIVEK